MGHHGFKPKRHRRRMDRNEGRDRDDDFARAPFPRVAVLGGIALWTLLALGLWALIDPLLVWGAGMVGPGADVAVGVARWFGLGGEAAALRDATDVNGLGGGRDPRLCQVRARAGLAGRTCCAGRGAGAAAAPRPMVTPGGTAAAFRAPSRLSPRASIDMAVSAPPHRNARPLGAHGAS